MNIQKFETKLNDIRLKNGWTITLNFTGIWEIIVYDKESGRRLGSTGCSGIRAILVALSTPLSSTLWGN